MSSSEKKLFLSSKRIIENIGRKTVKRNYFGQTNNEVEESENVLQLSKYESFLMKNIRFELLLSDSIQNF